MKLMYVFINLKNIEIGNPYKRPIFKNQVYAFNNLLNIEE